MTDKFCDLEEEYEASIARTEPSEEVEDTVCPVPQTGQLHSKANVFPRVNNTSIVCPKLATVYKVCHIRYKSMGTIMKAVTFVVCNA